MAYAATGATMAAGAAWLTDRPGTLTFTGDYRAHLHLEGSPPSPAGDGAAAPPPLYRHQRALPRLPVTPLRESAACYLQSVRALATPAEFRHTQAAVAKISRRCLHIRGSKRAWSSGMRIRSMRRNPPKIEVFVVAFPGSFSQKWLLRFLRP